MKKITTMTVRKIIFLFVLWQLIATYLIISGIFSPAVIWVNLGISILFILLADPYESALLLILSIPFYVVLPNSRFDTFATWRVLFAVLFLNWFVRLSIKRQKTNIVSLITFMPWDRYLGVFMLVAIILLPFSRFPVQSAKQIIFFANIYLLYVVLINTIKTKKQVIEVITCATISAALIVFIGYAQLALTFFTTFEYFWKAWAILVSKLYYGAGLAGVLLYSNSWFAYTGGESLRMFSIMPDSHSFAIVSIFAMSFLLMLTYKITGKKKEDVKKEGMLETELKFIQHKDRVFGLKTNYWIWSAVRFAGLAIILSGTRAAWVGLLAPLIAVLWFMYKKYAVKMSKKVFWSLFLVLVFFALSPFINQALNIVRVDKFQENFIDRAKSIYDVNEESNLGRLRMWERSALFAVKHPLGVGLGNFLVSLTTNSEQNQDYANIANQHNSNFNLPQKYVTAHNLYLQIFVELGILGLAAFILFWWKYFSYVWQFIKSHLRDDNILSFYVLDIAMAFGWILAAAFFDVTFFNDKVLMYFFISLAISGIILNKYHDLIKET
jgi:O-antigen ligase